MRTALIRCLVGIALAVSTIVFAAPAAAAPTVQYEPPVDAPINDPFRPPATPYGPGNRGIEYATAPGSPVRAAADGTVTFAGVVAAKRWVTIEHADRVRTTYGPLDAIDVSAGATVERGEVIGTTAGLLMFTARVDDAYIDSASLFDGPVRVHLVPEPLDTPQLRALKSSGWSLPGADALMSAIDWERRHLEAVPSFLVSLTPAPAVTSAVDALVDWHQRDAECTSAADPAPVLAERHRAVLVAGLGSSSDDAAVDEVDTSGLGYGADDVVRFSYRGGDTTTSPYAPVDTTIDINESGRRLAAFLADTVDRTSVPIDVIAHSQGGLVVRVALAELEATRLDVLTRLGTVVTLGTPHHGADLADVVAAMNAQPAGAMTLDAIEAAADVPMSADADAIGQLATGSEFVRELAAHPVPPGVRFVSIAARGDMVVPAPRSHLDGATNVVVAVDGPSAHDRLPATGEATREFALALNHAAPTCESAVDAVLDATSGRLIANAEHAIAVTQGG